MFLCVKLTLHPECNYHVHHSQLTSWLLMLPFPLWRAEIFCCPKSWNNPSIHTIFTQNPLFLLDDSFLHCPQLRSINLSGLFALFLGSLCLFVCHLIFYLLLPFLPVTSLFLPFTQTTECPKNNLNIDNLQSCISFWSAFHEQLDIYFLRVNFFLDEITKISSEQRL